MRDALISTLVVGIAATLGDGIWATFLSNHVMAAGLVHGALLCLTMGAMIARPAGRMVAGAIGGIAIGLTGAGIFYLLAPMMRYSAMFPAWFALWVMLAGLSHVLGGGRDLKIAVTRGLMAGVASGLAFYLISGMWTRWNPAAINYLEHFARWTFAFAPGFFVLQGGRAAVRTGSGVSNAT